jgi:hypothetical protein
MMLSAILLSSSLLVTHAPGWSDPMITTDMWSYEGEQGKILLVFGADTLHQAWHDLNQETRIGYKAYLSDGTVVFPETMISHDVWSAYPTGTLVGSDSIAFFWRQGVPAWYCARDSAGGEAVTTSLFQWDTYYNRPKVEVTSDSLGRIHAVTVIPEGVLYTVTEPGVGEVWRDTVPGSQHETAGIQMDGNRVHIIYRSGFDIPAYVQYDLQGNITIPQVILVEDLSDFSPTFSTALDGNGDVYCFARVTRSWNYLTLFKVDGATGEVLICDKEIWDPLYSSTSPTILPMPSGDRLCLLWIEDEQDAPRHVMHSVIDTDGDFIEAPYSAYDYTDEEDQNIFVLEATINELGDVFAIWSAYFPEVDPNAYYIVMGWFDHNWVGIEDGTGPIEPGAFQLHHSVNPFRGSVTLTVEGSPVPGQLAVYDLSGRIVRTIFRNSENSFLWDGCSADGEELPAGTYVIQGASAGSFTSVKVVKL